MHQGGCSDETALVSAIEIDDAVFDHQFDAGAFRRFVERRIEHDDLSRVAREPAHQHGPEYMSDRLDDAHLFAFALQLAGVVRSRGLYGGLCLHRGP